MHIANHKYLTYIFYHHINCLIFDISVCAAGHYGSGYSCIRCGGNTIKILKGDAANCSTDRPCDGASNVPNSGGTACGEFRTEL